MPTRGITPASCSPIGWTAPPGIVCACGWLPIDQKPHRARSSQGVRPGETVPSTFDRHRPALHRRQAAQPLHFLHFAGIDAGHRVGRHRADRGDLGDERLRAGTARAHPRHGLARHDHRLRRQRARLAVAGRRGEERPARGRRGAVHRARGHAAGQAHQRGDDPRRGASARKQRFGSRCEHQGR